MLMIIVNMDQQVDINNILQTGDHIRATGETIICS